MSVKYHIELNRGDRRLPVVLDAEAVIPWLEGFAAARDEEDVLEDLDEGSEDTRRVHALQLGEAAGWFRYLWPEYPPKQTEG